MRSAEESRKISELAKLEEDPIYKKTRFVLEHFEKYIEEAARSGETRFRIYFNKPGYGGFIVSYGMSEGEIFDVFTKYVAPQLRELGYVVETATSVVDYEILVKW